MPVGSIIVKEKWWWDGNPRHLAAYAAMTKREPGFDTDHGDWEYLYVELGNGFQEPTMKPQVARGRLQECIGCHQAASAKDYLYREYKNRLE